jgi:hypothetical protein
MFFEKHTAQIQLYESESLFFPWPIPSLEISRSICYVRFIVRLVFLVDKNNEKENCRPALAHGKLAFC